MEYKDIVYNIEDNTYSDGFSTTFWSDFSIADRFGVDAIQDTYNRCFEEWKSSYRYLTDLVGTLNHKLWQHYENGNFVYAKLYDALWRKCDDYAINNLQGEELDYFVGILD